MSDLEPVHWHLDGAARVYGERIVLHPLQLHLRERRIGIIGANGSGKSTLARMLNGLVPPSEGRVLVDGLDTRQAGRAVRRQVGFVFTDADAQIVMPTVAEDLRFSLTDAHLTARAPAWWRHGAAARAARRALRAERAERELAADERVAAALAEIGLTGHADHAAHLLSGGQKQMLALSAVLLSGPRAVVLDEPTTLLDARNARRFGERLSTLDQQVVLVTHQLDLVRDVERVLVVDEGRIVADGEPGEALAHYRRLIAS